VTGKCTDDSYDGDPFKNLGIEIIISGESGKSDELVAPWYLDRFEPENTGTNDSGLEGDFVHPRYHFQFGGNEMKGRDCGDLILLKSPRLAHPPMDGVLAVDFVLSNFFPSEWSKLKKDNEYAGVISSAQRRYWKSYATALTLGWEGNPSSEPWTVYNLWPQVPR
jgi:hypothetical protein